MPNGRSPGDQTPTPRAPGPKPQPPRRAIPGWVWWLALAAVLAFNVYAYGISRNPSRVTLTYSQFLDQVSAGNVTSVDITGQQVTGSLKNAIAQPAASATEAPSGSTASPSPSASGQ